MIYIAVIVTTMVSAVIVAYHCIDNFGVGINEFKARYKKSLPKLNLGRLFLNNTLIL